MTDLFDIELSLKRDVKLRDLQSELARFAAPSLLEDYDFDQFYATNGVVPSLIVSCFEMDVVPPLCLLSRMDRVGRDNLFRKTGFYHLVAGDNNPNYSRLHSLCLEVGGFPVRHGKIVGLFDLCPDVVCSPRCCRSFDIPRLVERFRSWDFSHLTPALQEILSLIQSLGCGFVLHAYRGTVKIHPGAFRANSIMTTEKDITEIRSLSEDLGFSKTEASVSLLPLESYIGVDIPNLPNVPSAIPGREVPVLSPGTHGAVFIDGSPDTKLPFTRLPKVQLNSIIMSKRYKAEYLSFPFGAQNEAYFGAILIVTRDDDSHLVYFSEYCYSRKVHAEQEVASKASLFVPAVPMKVLRVPSTREVYSALWNLIPKRIFFFVPNVGIPRVQSLITDFDPVIFGQEYSSDEIPPHFFDQFVYHSDLPSAKLQAQSGKARNLSAVKSKLAPNANREKDLVLHRYIQHVRGGEHLPLAKYVRPYLENEQVSEKITGFYLARTRIDLLRQRGRKAFAMDVNLSDFFSQTSGWTPSTGIGIMDYIAYDIVNECALVQYGHLIPPGPDFVDYALFYGIRSKEFFTQFNVDVRRRLKSGNFYPGASPEKV